MKHYDFPHSMHSKWLRIYFSALPPKEYPPRNSDNWKQLCLNSTSDEFHMVLHNKRLEFHPRIKEVQSYASHSMDQTKKKNTQNVCSENECFNSVRSVKWRLSRDYTSPTNCTNCCWTRLGIKASNRRYRLHSAFVILSNFKKTAKSLEIKGRQHFWSEECVSIKAMSCACCYKNNIGCSAERTHQK